MIERFTLPQSQLAIAISDYIDIMTSIYSIRSNTQQLFIPAAWFSSKRGRNTSAHPQHTQTSRKRENSEGKGPTGNGNCILT